MNVILCRVACFSILQVIDFCITSISVLVYLFSAIKHISSSYFDSFSLGELTSFFISYFLGERLFSLFLSPL